MSKRIIALLLGLVIGYFAIYAGDGIHMAVKEVSDIKLLVILAATGTLLVCFFVGIWAWGMATFSESEYEEVMAALALVLLCLVFGAMAAPFTHYGAAPWFWASRWDILPLLAIVPTVLSANQIIVELFARRAKSAAENSNNVHQMRRNGS